jgi:acetyltransferase
VEQLSLDVIVDTGGYTRLSVHIRRAQLEDVELLVGLLSCVSDHSRYLRYFQPLPHVPSQFWVESKRMVKQNAGHGITLVATIQPEAREIIAVAELARNMATPQHGEVAMLVRDDYQNRGVGGVLGRQLVKLARNCGLTHLHADVLPENCASLHLLHHFGVPYATSFVSGIRHAVLHL